MLNSPGSNNELLTQLEDLAALTDGERIGVVHIKPFRDWASSPWAKRIFEFRLCNVGELIDVNNELDKLPAYTREFALKIELVLRSIYKIDDTLFVPEEEVATYNERNKTNLSRIEYLRSWIKNVEPVVLDRLNSIYEALEAKQVRMLTNYVMCEFTGKMFPKDSIPKGGVFIKNCIGEIISKEGLELEAFDKSLYDIDIIKEKIDSNTSEKSEKIVIDNEDG